MDHLDIVILDRIQRDPKVRQSDIAETEGVSVSTVNDRLRRLQERGVIAGTFAHLAPEAVGLDVCAFVQVLISSPDYEAAFVTQVEALEPVQECHCITGDFSYLLKVRVPTPRALERFLRDEIKSLPGVTRTNSLIALSTSKETLALPLVDYAPVAGKDT